MFATCRLTNKIRKSETVNKWVIDGNKEAIHTFLTSHSHVIHRIFTGEFELNVIALHALVAGIELFQDHRRLKIFAT